MAGRRLVARRGADKKQAELFLGIDRVPAVIGGSHYLVPVRHRHAAYADAIAVANAPAYNPGLAYSRQREQNP